MAKSVLKKKKTNRRLRKSVRRTLGALCMMTAIIVAAIPFPDSAAGPGDNPGGSGSGSGNSGAAVVSEYQYTPNSADDLVIKDVISGVEYTTKDSLTSGVTVINMLPTTKLSNVYLGLKLQSGAVLLTSCSSSCGLFK